MIWEDMDIAWLYEKMSMLGRRIWMTMKKLKLACNTKGPEATKHAHVDVCSPIHTFDKK